ncbi:MAG TPA: hypothetical protein VKB69_08240 [Micromonosporaceae bacterium]|nr:hypothetical protein [Micromonosporaceae bacterium]
MTKRIRTVTYIVAGALVVATTVGCGFLSAAKKLASSASIISDFENKLQAGETAVYKATYSSSDGSTVTVQQQPPKSVYVSDTGPWIFDGTTSYLCDNSGGSMTCTKTVYTSSADINAAFSASTLAAGGFLAAGTAIVLITTAAFVPGAKVVQSTKTIAGQKSSCVDVTNIPEDQGSTDPVSFTICVTDTGVMAQYSGTDASGKTEGMVLKTYTSNVDPSLFEPPPGATIVDSANPFPSGAPSASPEPGPSAPSLAPSPVPSGSPSG